MEIENIKFDLGEMNCTKNGKVIKIVRAIDVPVWCFKNDKREWEEYKAEDSQKIEVSFKKLNPFHQIQAKNVSYIVHFATMIQKRNSTMSSVNNIFLFKINLKFLFLKKKKVRNVKRIAPYSESWYFKSQMPYCKSDFQQVYMNEEEIKNMIKENKNKWSK